LFKSELSLPQAQMKTNTAQPCPKAKSLHRNRTKLPRTCHHSLFNSLKNKTKEVKRPKERQNDLRKHASDLINQLELASRILEVEGWSPVG
jgi:hypothetical protein